MENNLPKAEFDALKSLIRNKEQKQSSKGVLKKGVLRNFAKFTGKYLCQSLFFNKVSGMRHRCFLLNFEKFLRTPFLIEHLRWLLLKELIIQKVDKGNTVVFLNRKVAFLK